MNQSTKQTFLFASFFKSSFSPIGKFLSLAVIVTAFFAFSASAQTTTADLSGIIADEAGAVVPNVTVRAINIATNFERQATTNDDGAFTIPLLPPGNYTLRTERAGFAPVEINDVVLNVNDRRTIRINLKVGSPSATVTVENTSPLINESPTVSTVIERRFLENLPLNGRSFQSLLALTPGVVPTTNTFFSKGQFSVNGQRANSNYFTVDGVSANTGIGNNIGNVSSEGGVPAFTAFGGTNSLASVDAVQEFRVQTSTFAAEFGRTPGGQVSIVTRSGTNDLRGTIFEYFRNDALDANDWISNSLRLPKSALRQNQFGGVIGGPIFKDKTFFFGSYEGLRLLQPRSRITEVPTLELRQAAPAFTRALLNAYPLPNGQGTRPGFQEFIGSWSDPSTLDAYSVRIDQTLSSRLNLFGRYSDAPSSTEERGPFSSALSRRLISNFRSQSLTLGGSVIASSQIVNEFRFNFTNSRAGSSEQLDDFGGATPVSLSAFGLPGSIQNPGVYIAAGSNQYFFAPGNALNRQRQFNFVDTLSLTVGNHQIKFGIDYRRLSPRYKFLDYELYLYLGNEAQIRAGNATYEVYSHQDGIGSPVFNNFSAFAQDTWKVFPRLTLTYGLRWEVNPPPTDSNDYDAYTVIGLDNPATMTLAPKGTPLWKTTYNNFAPRFGVSYQLSDSTGYNTVLRGGFGIFYDLGTDQSGRGFGGSGNLFPYSSYKSGSLTPLPLSAAALTPLPISLNPRYGLLNVADANLKLPYTLQWNLTAEQFIGARQSLTASYVGAAGRRLLRQDRLVNPNPNFSTVYATRNTSVSDYHALQLQHQLRLTKGLQSLTSYTWSHSLDTSSDSAGGPTSNEGLPSGINDVSRDRASSDFDVRHAFSSAVTYDLPFSKFNSFFDALLRDWGTDAIFVYRSATPVNIISSRSSYTLRPDLVPNVPLYIDDSTVPGGRRINRAAFVIPTTLRQGTLITTTQRDEEFGVMNKSVLSLRNLTAGYPATSRGKAHVVAENLSVDLPAGELVCLIGPNGAGKSTLMRTVAGMQKPLSGQVLLDGADIHQMSAREIAKRLSVVLTERISAGMMTAYELVALGRHPHTNWAGTLTEHDHQVVKDSIQTAGAAELAHRLVGELSDGEKQKVMVARALAQEPRLMILDEITAFLDLPRRVDVMRLLRDLAHAANRSILLSTHDLDLALRTSDRLWLLPKGGDFQTGVPEDLVLSGKFAAAFASEGIEFNEHEGSFRLNKNYHGAVYLTGEGLPAVWTARALERQGYRVLQNGDTIPDSDVPRIEITEENNRPSWQLFGAGKRHSSASLDELLKRLKK